MGSEGVAFLDAYLGADIMKISMGVIIGTLEIVVTMLADADDHDVVGEDAPNHIKLLGYDQPWPKENSDEQHAEWTSLGMPHFLLCGLPKPPAMALRKSILSRKAEYALRMPRGKPMAHSTA